MQAQSTTWNVTLNASTNRNKLLRLAPGIKSNNGGTYQRQVPGYPLYGYWGPRATYADADDNGLITADEVTIADTDSYLGSSLPKVETSLSTQWGLFRGALTLGALFDARVGGKVYDRGPFIATIYGTSRAQNVPASLLEQARVAVLSQLKSNTSLAFVDGSFVRFRELSLLYSVPQRWTRLAHAQSLGVSLKVRNLGLWSRYDGDPEVSSPLGGASSNDSRGNFGSAIPLPRTWLVSFNVGF
jgi:hypothetical protein